ncbi:MAG: hypothetical protein H7A21_03730 [Spirochaetales bacterium]|nr:hypothetical protein [Spirochaetales bacterium]
MELQHINIKIFAAKHDGVTLQPAAGVFHRWIQSGDFTEELLLDVADYAHVPAGPGIMLIGHEAFYGLEFGAENRLGLLYNQRTRVEGTNKERISLALRRAIRAAKRLESEPEYKGKLTFQLNDALILANDRLLVPNQPASFEALRDDIEAALSSVSGGGSAKLEYEQGDGRSRFQVRLKIAVPTPLHELASASGS